jgi:hypothetical protein
MTKHDPQKFLELFQIDGRSVTSESFCFQAHKFIKKNQALNIFLLKKYKEHLSI